MLAVVAALSVFGGCRRAAPVDAPAGNEATMAALGTVRALHHEADVYEDGNRLERASDAMRRVLALPLPAGLAEREDVRADAWGRLAEFSIRSHRAGEALAIADEALRATRRESVLQARLLMVRGQALRVLAEAAAASGDAATAARQREMALASLEQSIEVNGRILRRLTDGGAR